MTDTLFYIQSLIIIICVPLAVANLFMISIPYFFEPFLNVWRNRRTAERREWEQQIEARIERLEKHESHERKTES